MTKEILSIKGICSCVLFCLAWRDIKSTGHLPTSHSWQLLLGSHSPEMTSDFICEKVPIDEGIVCTLHHIQAQRNVRHLCVGIQEHFQADLLDSETRLQISCSRRDTWAITPRKYLETLPLSSLHSYDT